MRESNISNPSQGKAAVCISAVVYDRRALDGTAILPLINSLNHLNYLTSTSPRIREMVSIDGGLSRLVRILQSVPRRPASSQRPPQLKELQANWKWSLAFQCAVNIGVRGSEAIRTRVVEAGMIPVVLRILESYLYAAQLLEEKQLRAARAAESRAAQELRRSVYPLRDEVSERAPSVCESMISVTPSSPNSTDISCGQGSGESSMNGRTSCDCLPGTMDASASASASASADEDEGETEVVADELSIKATPRPRERELMDVDSNGATPRVRRNIAAAEDISDPEMPQVYREEEVLLSLQLLAYLSKYPHVRLFFHNADIRGGLFFNPLWQDDTLPNRPWSPEDPVRQNVFSIAERFTLRPSRSNSAAILCTLFPRLGPEIQYWAGVVMRNACRKDESRGGIRQCANMYCGRWESYPREFAKCRRCRKAKYCSKQCQSKGWQTGHRYWCSARSEDDDKRSSRTETQRTVSMPVAEAPTMAPQVQNVHAMPVVPAQMADSNTSSPQPSRYPTTLRPPGGPALPSTLRAVSQQLPSLRGVSTASIETLDPMDASDDNMRQSFDMTMADIPQHTDTAGRPLPPPVIIGGIEGETHPATNELLNENDGFEEPGTIDFMTTQWLASVQQEPVPGPSVPPREQTTTLLDLGIDGLDTEHNPQGWLNQEPRNSPGFPTLAPQPAYLTGILRTGARSVLTEPWGSDADVSMSGTGVQL
ncbi:hypothetical protein MCUN1_002981 [Malassezia cuniculi]|uniref:MYND-type domain-containing protein n=1 Tax=Malassezia cuniculi TaxID=948313 RepID=A0AAF0EW28_9BASI|nr:hypothetical protein MCUN1_002981 [Malassezia cuniculi]